VCPIESRAAWLRRCESLSTRHRWFRLRHPETTPERLTERFMSVNAARCRKTLVSCCENTASIACGLFARCSRPTLLPMKLHQHQFAMSGHQASSCSPGHTARETCHAYSVSRRATLLIAVPLFVVLVILALAPKRRASLSLEGGPPARWREEPRVVPLAARPERSSRCPVSTKERYPRRPLSRRCWRFKILVDGRRRRRLCHG